MVFCSILVPYRIEEQATSTPVAEFLQTKLVTLLGILDPIRSRVDPVISGVDQLRFEVDPVRSIIVCNILTCKNFIFFP